MMCINLEERKYFIDNCTILPFNYEKLVAKALLSEQQSGFRNIGPVVIIALY